MFYYHKGLTRAARRTVATAITIAGRQGCTAVDTGHLLLAMLQTGRGTAVEFLRRKQITCVPAHHPGKGRDPPHV